MNTISNRTQFTIPWGPGTTMPPEKLKQEAKVRSLIKITQTVAETHIDESHRDPGYSPDLDPDPARILRRRRLEDDRYILEIKTDGHEEPRPTSLRYQTISDDSLSQIVKWRDGEIVDFSVRDGNNFIGFQVNDNGTLTYTEQLSDEPKKS